MIGRRYASEMRTYRDPISGLWVTQLTATGVNSHLYFTDNSFTMGSNEIIFLSDRGGAGLCINMFSLDLNTGEMTQLTDEANGIAFHQYTKTPDSEYIAYITDNKLRVLHRPTSVIRTVYEDDQMEFGSIFISPDKQWIGMTRNEKVSVEYNTRENYHGFKEKMYDIKDGRISVVRLNGGGFHDVFCDTHWLGHFQFSPDNANIAMFCHEGPWNYVQQRIWLIAMTDGRVWPCFRQQEDDSVGHEFWTRDGRILFDNRRKGHDGTITSDKTQAVTPDAVSDQRPYFGFADKTGRVVRTVDMPFYCNHYHGNAQSTLFVGDAVEDIVLIDTLQKPPAVKVLARHDTSWRYQRSHPHPTFSWDDSRILYASDRDNGLTNLYLLEMDQLNR